MKFNFLLHFTIKHLKHDRFQNLQINYRLKPVKHNRYSKFIIYLKMLYNFWTTQKISDSIKIFLIN